MKDKLLQIINHYGTIEQLKYIHSEYYELDEAIILKEVYGSKRDKALERHIAEEISDIMVMLKQFQHYYEITDEEIEKVMEYKINRQLERIEKE